MNRWRESNNATFLLSRCWSMCYGHVLLDAKRFGGAAGPRRPRDARRGTSTLISVAEQGMFTRPCRATMAAESHAPSPSLGSLEARLQRIQYALNGDNEIEERSSTHPPAESTAAIRLRNLERQMRLVESKSSAAEDVLSLQSKHLDIFQQVTDASQSNLLPLTSQAALVLSHAQLYSRVSGQLQSLQDASVPDSASASKLLELRPRINKAAVRQEQQAKELAELRSRSAAAVEQWYETGVLGMAERWAEWEERMRDVEIVVRRLEAVKKREQELV